MPWIGNIFRPTGGKRGGKTVYRDPGDGRQTIIPTGAHGPPTQLSSNATTPSTITSSRVVRPATHKAKSCLKHKEAQPVPAGVSDEDWGKIYNSANSRIYNSNAKKNEVAKAARASGKTYKLALKLLRDRIRDGAVVVGPDYDLSSETEDNEEHEHTTNSNQRGRGSGVDDGDKEGEQEGKDEEYHPAKRQRM